LPANATPYYQQIRWQARSYTGLMSHTWRHPWVRASQLFRRLAGQFPGLETVHLFTEAVMRQSRPTARMSLMESPIRCSMRSSPGRQNRPRAASPIRWGAR